MKTIYIRYDGWTPSVLGDAVSGQVNTLRCSFAFSADWDAYQNRKAIFETDDAKKEESLDENGVCRIPRAVLTKRGKLKISAYGTETGENGELLRYNGRPAEIIVDLGGNVDGEITDDPVYPQIGEAVLYTAQSLTDAQKAQARANIGAGTPYTLPEASPDALGGVKADAAEETDTQPVRKGTDGKLYTAPGAKTQSNYYQNDITKPDYIKNRPGGFLTEQNTVKLDISAEKQDGIAELTNVSVLTDDFMHQSSINVEIGYESGLIQRTLTQRYIREYIINMYGATVYGNAHLIDASQPDTGEDVAIYKETDASSNYSIGWHVWATSVPSGSVEVRVTQKISYTVPFYSEFIPWDSSPTKDAVLYTAQSMTEEQQAQARANIGAGTPYTLPEASSDALGGVKADAAAETDTQPVRIGEDGKLYTAPGGGGADISLGISGATAGQMAKVKAVDESGAPTAWEAGDAAGGEEWIQLADVTLEEAVSTLSQTWVDTPMKKIRILLETVSATSNTNYMPVSVSTKAEEENMFLFFAAKFYPTALPLTSAKHVEYTAEMLKVGEYNAVRFTEYLGGIRGLSSSENNKIFALDAEKSAVSTGNYGYSWGFNDSITGILFSSYATFEVGTKFKIWGVAK